MDVTTTLEAPCPAPALFAAVADLQDYPNWLSIVVRVEPAEDGGDGPVWVVDLRGRLGPLARSKRLRMVRTRFEPSGHVRFERAETDGRVHAPWILDAEVASRPTGSALTMRLHYGGSFASSLLERMLAHEIEQSRPRLLERVAAAGS